MEAIESGSRKSLRAINAGQGMEHMPRDDRLETVEVTSTTQLRAWLEAHHQQREGIWLVTYKKHTGDTYVSRSDVIDEVLCFGWTDGRGRKLDHDRTMQLLSPRWAHDWAKSYKDRVARLAQAGRMHPAGLWAIAEAKRRGGWDRMDDVDAVVTPDDLLAALAANPPADDNFARFSRSSRRNILRWIKRAKTPATRAKRVAQTAALAAQNERVPQM